MFDDEVFQEWLDRRATEAFAKLGGDELITNEEMMSLALKARSRQLLLLEHDLRSEIKKLRQESENHSKANEKHFEEMHKYIDLRAASVLKFVGIGMAVLGVLIWLVE